MKYISDRIKNIYDYYGPGIETNKFYEEIEEVKKAVKNDDRENLIEELADIFITSRHMMYRFNISEGEVKKIIEYKLERQKFRMLIDKISSKLTDENKAKLNENIIKIYFKQQGGK